MENFEATCTLEELAVILAACSRALTSPCHEKPLKKITVKLLILRPSRRNIAADAKLGVPPPLQPDDIVFSVSDSILTLVAYLFCNYPELQPEPKPWVVASDALDRAMAAWSKLKEQWVKASPQHRSEKNLGTKEN